MIDPVSWVHAALCIFAGILPGLRPVGESESSPFVCRVSASDACQLYDLAEHFVTCDADTLLGATPLFGSMRHERKLMQATDQYLWMQAGREIDKSVSLTGFRIAAPLSALHEARILFS